MMNLNFSWQRPTVSEDIRNRVEALVTTMASEIMLLAGRKEIAVNFAADVPHNSPLLATVIDGKTGHLLGALEAPRSELAICFVALGREDARVLLSL